MEDIVFNIQEAKENIPEGHFWDSIKEQCISSYKDNQSYHFVKIDNTNLL